MCVVMTIARREWKAKAKGYDSTVIDMTLFEGRNGQRSNNFRAKYYSIMYDPWLTRSVCFLVFVLQCTFCESHVTCVCICICRKLVASLER